jgi:hypothetical protein
MTRASLSVTALLLCVAGCVEQGDAPPDFRGGAGGVGGAGGAGGADAGGKSGAGGEAGDSPSSGGAGGMDNTGGVNASGGSGGMSGSGGSGGNDSDASAGEGGMGGMAGSDGGGDDEPAVDSTNPDHFFGTARCEDLSALEPGAVLACEDFEAVAVGALPGAPWERRGYPNEGDPGAPALRVGDERAARGERSLHLTVDDLAEAYLHMSEGFPTEDNAHYGRLFFYVASPITRLDSTIHWNAVEALGPGMLGDESFTTLVRYGGTYNNFADDYVWNYEQRPRPTGFDEIATGDGHALELDEWVCIEWYFGPGNESRFWRNGAEVAELHTMPPVDGREFAFPTFEGVNIGWAIYQAVETPFEVWVDSIAIATTRVGCAR